jgi:hypothetical protein
MRHDAQHLEDLPPRIAARADDSQGERGVDRNGGHGRVPGRRGSEDAPRERQADLEDLPPRIAARAGDSQGERGVDRNGGHGRVPDRRGSEDAPRERQAEGALRGRERIPPLYAVALRCPCCAMSCRCQKFNWSRNRTWVVRGGAGLVSREDSVELEAASNILISDVGFLVGVFWAVDLEEGR